MNEIEHLLTCLAEECAEVGQRCSKALRFGVAEVQDGQTLNNGERIALELVDVVAVTQMLVERGVLPDPWKQGMGHLAKIQKVQRFMEFSRSKGTLT